MENKSHKRFKLFSALTLFFSLLVVLAGSLVKASGAGMGCPDWPKCYGYWIPPMDEKEVVWEANKSFESGQIIVHENKLLVANDNFKASVEFDASQWTPYKKHDYAIYKPEHTIIEYLNRLCGVVLGIMAILMVFYSRVYRKEKPIVFWGSIIMFIIILFEGYLGAKVVESNLKPLKISMHLYLAFLILIVIAFVRSRVVDPLEIEESKRKSIKKWLMASVILLCAQLVMGTNVRQTFDDLRLSGIIRESWIDESGWLFLVHRSFSLVYAAITGVTLYFLYELKVKHFATKWMLVLMLLIIATGVIMGYFEVPQFARPVHLLLSSILLSYSCVLLFAMRKK
jgi:cytochrome c oxidase assembly protein subunit 15